MGFDAVLNFDRYYRFGGFSVIDENGFKVFVANGT